MVDGKYVSAADDEGLYIIVPVSITTCEGR